MRHIFKTTAIASSLVTASFFVGTGMANAQIVNGEATVPFVGIVGSVCEFGAPTPGALGVPANNPETLSSSLADGGAPGTVLLSCNAGFDLSVNEPLPTGGPATALTRVGSTATAELAGLPAASLGNPILSLIPVTAGLVTVNMSYTADAPIPAALNPYTFNVLVTAAPQ